MSEVKKRKAPLTPGQKRARGQHYCGKVGTVEVFLSLQDSKRLGKLTGANREAFLNLVVSDAIERETKKQSASAEANAPMVFGLTDRGHLITKQTGTRQWCIMSKVKVGELISRIKDLKAFHATMPDQAGPSIELADDADADE